MSKILIDLIIASNISYRFQHAANAQNRLAASIAVSSTQQSFVVQNRNRLCSSVYDIASPTFVAARPYLKQPMQLF